jgi:hypothetical protein
VGLFQPPRIAHVERQLGVRLVQEQVDRVPRDRPGSAEDQNLLHGSADSGARRRNLPRLLALQRRHVDCEAILYVGFEQPLVGLVHVLNGDHFDIGGDVVRAAESG